MIFIQDPDSGAYLAGDSVWTPERGRARQFRRVPEAMEYCHQKNWLRMEVILGCSDPQFDVKLKVGSPSPPAPPAGRTGPVCGEG